MKLITYIIIIECITLGIFLFRLLYSKRLNSTSLAEYLTIFGVVFGLSIYFDLVPQDVRISKEEKLSIGSLEAKERVSGEWKNLKKTFGYPQFYFSTYIFNTGDLPVADPVLLFKIENEPGGFFPYRNLNAYIYDGTNTLIKKPTSLDWVSDSSGNNVIEKIKGKSFYEITLPPILVNHSVSVIVGYQFKDYLKFPMYAPNLDSIVNGNLTVMIMERVKSNGNYSLNDSLKGREYKLFEKRCFKFTRLTFEYHTLDAF